MTPHSTAKAASFRRLPSRAASISNVATTCATASALPVIELLDMLVAKVCAMRRRVVGGDHEASTEACR